jgi:tight adherence protein C
MPITLIGLILLIVASLAAAAYVLTLEHGRRQIVDRTSEPAVASAPITRIGHAPNIGERFVRWLAVTAPGAMSSTGKTEQQLIQAGYDSPMAPLVYSSVRLVLIVGLPILVGLAVATTQLNIVLIDVAGAVVVAALLPMWFLARKVRVRQDRIRRALPDALDLLVVCIEAGISLDAAVLRVAKDLGSVHPDLAAELLIVNRKTNIGMARADALRGLWTRTGVQEIRAMVSHIIQGERWGTSSGKVLRVYAETLRRQRRQAAEKKAATAPVKMLVPLGIFIFPALLLVILGPVIMNVKTLFTK